MDDAGDGVGFEWRCEHCGDRSPKHNPPCSNCGGMQFEQVPVNSAADVEAAESLVPTTRRALLGYGAAGAVAAVGGGYLLWDAYTPPEIPDAPGNSERAGGISLSAAADEILAAVNDQRETPLSATESARSAARYATAYTVVEGDGSARELYGRLDEFRIGRFQVVRRVVSGDGSQRGIDGFADADAVASTFVESFFANDDVRAFLLNERFSNAGVDVHVDPDGDVYASMVVATGGGLV
ncbi:zinc ribbon-containing protein [Halorubellus sp. JP-L1]|uniref:zinc ribbon-containing protein n=1 Tax=Halorubellus sp. JP-L1 TaxID=2715753 RepID=UPI00140D1AEA|nr:zinc ribbon-containing protein [Halorubellus sp. JP-L1]NHN41340.1 zinc ribbon-containing protein [Halorubellus sp. JP-L1]